MKHIYLLKNDGNGGFSKAKKQVAHLWHADAGDTYCTMFSTGGLRKNRYSISEKHNGHKVCAMCWQNYNNSKLGK